MSGSIILADINPTPNCFFFLLASDVSILSGTGNDVKEGLVCIAEASDSVCTWCDRLRNGLTFGGRGYLWKSDFF